MWIPSSCGGTVAGGLAALDLTPLAEGPEHEDGDDAHPASGEDGAEEQPDAERQAAVALALELHERVADEPPGEPADEDRHEGGDACSGGGERGERAFVGVDHDRQSTGISAQVAVRAHAGSAERRRGDPVPGSGDG